MIGGLFVKITDSDTIKNSEKELIDAITGDLDWSAIETLLRQKHNIGLQDDVEFRNGDITVFDSQIAYKLDFDVKITLTVVFDRKGNCLKLSAAGDDGTKPLDSEEEEQSHSEEPQSGNKPDDTGVKPIASEIAGMISEINNS